MKYRFQYIESVPTLPNAAMVRGSFVHRVLELLLARAAQDRTLDAVRMGRSSPLRIVCE